jgi:hypothetical protein
MLATANPTWYQSRHEQKHLLHNWSNRCHRNRPQIARSVLESWPFGATATSEEPWLLVLMATLSVSLLVPKLTVFLELEFNCRLSVTGYF